MKKIEFAELLMKNANLPTMEEAKRQTDIFLETMKEALVKEEILVFRGFGTFEKRVFKREMGRNPKTGEDIKITPKKYIKFKVGKELSEKLNSGKKNKKR